MADPNQRREIIYYAIYYTPTVGLVVIDGIRGLMHDIDDSTEITKLVGDLMQWTSEQNIHAIVTVGVFYSIPSETPATGAMRPAHAIAS